MSILEFQNISLNRDGKTLLSGINWKIEKGEAWILFGRNGSGKSLLLQIINGYLSPSDGQAIRFEYAHGEADLRENRKRIGYLHSYVKNTMHPNENVLEAVISGRFGSIGIYDRYEEIDRRKALRLLEITGTGQLSDRYFFNLSDGEKERVLIARALMADPELLLLDEPAANLDYQGREELLGALKSIHLERKEMAIVMVTHRVDDIISEFSKMLILKDGRVFKEGALSELLNSETISAALEMKLDIFEEYGRHWCIVKEQ